MKFLLACAACYGQSDSPMAQGMNWGIFSLLAIVVVVLGGIATCAICLARRSAAFSAAAARRQPESNPAPVELALGPEDRFHSPNPV